jgi:Family of unknown function (DUF5948)
MIGRLFVSIGLASMALGSPFKLMGGPAWCTHSSDGTGAANYQVTKDCCTATDHNAQFAEHYRTCMGYGGPADNAVDHGEFAKCCDSRGGGSHG